MAPSITDRGTPYQIALAVEALSREDDPGAVVRLAEWYGVSRQWVYSLKNRAREALHRLFRPSDRGTSAPQRVAVDRHAWSGPC